MHRAHSGSFRVRIEARHGWMMTENVRNSKRKSACGSKELNPPFPFPPRGKPGGDGSPHAASRSVPANIAGTAHAAAPPARGLRPLRYPPPVRCPRWQAASHRQENRKTSEDGRHVGLDFYDLLIEPVMSQAFDPVTCMPQLSLMAAATRVLRRRLSQVQILPPRPSRVF